LYAGMSFTLEGERESDEDQIRDQRDTDEM
jgi:hypothetical protein